MPLFDFQCSACEREFEYLVRGDDAAACPACGSRKLVRRMSVPARPAGASVAPDFSRLGPPAGGCCGGACQGHSH